MELSEVIKNRMQEKEFNANNLSKKSGVTNAAIHYILNGKFKNITIQTAFKLADALDMDINEFRWVNI